MALSDDSATVALALSRDTVRLIEAVSGRELATLEAPEAHDIYWLRFSPDGSRLAVLYRDGPVHIWDLRLIRGQSAEMKLDGLGTAPVATIRLRRSGTATHTITVTAATNSESG